MSQSQPPDPDADANPLLELSYEQQAALADLAQARADGLIGRRTALKALGASGLVAFLGGAASPAAAEASTSDSDGDVGTPSAPIDVFADGVEATSIEGGVANNDVITNLVGTNLSVSAGGTLNASLSGTSGKSLAELLAVDRVVVWSGTNGWGTEDPSSSNTPVQDAESNLGNTGKIWLPAGEITDTGPLDGFSRVTVEGLGVGRGLSSEHTSTLTIDGTGDGIRIDSYGDANWSYFHNFTLKADNQNDGRAAMRFITPSSPDEEIRMLNMGTMRFQNWTNTESNNSGTSGVISFEGGNCFRSHWNHIWMQEVGGPGFAFNGHEPYRLSIDHYDYAPHTESYAIRCDSENPNMEIGTIHAGSRFSDGLLYADTITANGMIYIGQAAYEPNQKTNQTNQVVYLDGSGHVHIGQIYIIDCDADRVVNFAGGSNKYVGPIRIEPSTTNINHTIEITGLLDGVNYYQGPASDVDDTAANNTDNLVTLAALADGTYSTG